MNDILDVSLRDLIVMLRSDFDLSTEEDSLNLIHESLMTLGRTQGIEKVLLMSLGILAGLGQVQEVADA